jgi:hypothetical protein
MLLGYEWIFLLVIIVCMIRSILMFAGLFVVGHLHRVNFRFDQFDEVALIYLVFWV